MINIFQRVASAAATRGQYSAAVLVALVVCSAVSAQPYKLPVPKPDSAVLQEILQEVKALRAEVAELKKQARDKPTAPGITVQWDDNAPTLGAPDAQLALIEFSDLQCPFCRRFHEQTLPQIRRNLIDSGRLQYQIRDFPLSFHLEAPGAAVAARCAGEQEQYWPMYDALFRNIKSLGNELYPKLAAELNLDVGAFNNCLKSDATAAAVKADRAAGQALGVTGTPAFFIGVMKDGKLVNAKKISGAQPYAVFEAAIREMTP